MSLKCFVCGDTETTEGNPLQDLPLHIAGVAGKVPDAHAAWVFRTHPELTDLTEFGQFGGMNRLAEIIRDDVENRAEEV